MNLKTCVRPDGRFVYGIHRPHFQADNFRAGDHRAPIGRVDGGDPVDNRANFPDGPVSEEAADWIYEIPNPFPFRGVTYIARSWAEDKARDPAAIRLPTPPAVSWCAALRSGQVPGLCLSEAFAMLPGPLKIALGTASTDSEDLVRLADGCAEFARDPLSGRPTGLVYEADRRGRLRPRVSDHQLFEAVANNVHLPDDYKRAMVLKPGAQGGSEIVGDFGTPAGDTHVFEYLRRNSYIPWGHYAANMADDRVRYRIGDLSAADVRGMRHLYYQRTYARLGRLLQIDPGTGRRPLTETELEDLRQRIVKRMGDGGASRRLDFDATLWGWNYGFDFSPSGYRLSASHQQIHQQFALVPRQVPAAGDSAPGDEGTAGIPAFAIGDPVASFTAAYRRETGRPFFDAYLEAIRTNRRMDNRRDCESDLTIRQDDRTLLFVPKAQTSQWEIQLMCRRPVGNILEADTQTRRSLDHGILAAVRLLSAMGARMITTYEVSKRFDSQDADQRLFYVFLPRIPQSPGGFSENQLRWITGHYPEDFAAACRVSLATAADGAGASPPTPGGAG